MASYARSPSTPDRTDDLLSALDALLAESGPTRPPSEGPSSGGARGPHAASAVSASEALGKLLRDDAEAVESRTLVRDGAARPPRRGAPRRPRTLVVDGALLAAPHAAVAATGWPLGEPLHRLGAHVVDLGVLAGLVVSYVLVETVGLEYLFEAWGFAGALALVAPAGVYLCLQLYLLSARGQTIGKRVTRLRIVDAETGTNPGFLRTVLLRMVVPAAITVVSIMAVFTTVVSTTVVPYVGLLFGLINPIFCFGERRRCLHDYIAGTVVIDER